MSFGSAAPPAGVVFRPCEGKLSGGGPHGAVMLVIAVMRKTLKAA